VTPETQGSKSSPSREHANVVSGWSASNVNVAVRASVVASGADSSVVVGGPITVHVRDAGVASTLSTRSTARTSSVCSPASSPPRSCGASQLSNGSPSSAHSNVALGSLELNVKIAGWPGRISPLGPAVIVVSGAVKSTIDHSHSAGSASTSRNGLVATTAKVCDTPGTRPS
jgi:hypothetical protein